jgi:hypothetical protein
MPGSGGRCRDRCFRGSCVLEPAPHGLDRHGSFVVEVQTNRNERQADYHYSDCLCAYKNYVGSTFPLQTRFSAHEDSRVGLAQPDRS